MFLEPVEVDYTALNWKETVKIVEDYKPLDIQSATMNYALAERNPVALSRLEISHRR